MNMADIGSVVRNLPGRLGIATGAETNNITHVWAFVCAGLVAEKGIAIARSKAIAGTPPHSNVVAAGGEELQRSPANSHVFLTTCQGVERNATKSRVSAISNAVGAIETVSAAVTDSEVELGGCVFPQRIGTNGRGLLLQSGRRWVGTSQDVTETLGINRALTYQAQDSRNLNTVC